MELGNTRVVTVAGRDVSKIYKNAISTILLFIILFIEGCFSFLDFSFNFNLIFNPAFWIVTGSKLIILICAKDIGMTVYEDIARAKNKGLQESMIQYEFLNKQRKNDFPNWVMKYLNPKTKKETYIAIMNKKINRLEFFSRSKSKLLYSRDLMEGETQEELDLKRKKNRYCRKRKALESFIDEKFIEKNITALSVRYTFVNPSNFDVDIYARANVPNLQIVAKNNKMKLSSLIFASLLLVVSNSLIEMIGYSFNNDEAISQAERFLNGLIKFMTNTAFVCWQFYQGIRAIINIIEKSEHLAYSNRNKILKEYLYKDNDKNDIDKIIELKVQKQKEMGA